jgi:capsular exopolysaccharide synthesis family protein
MTSFPGAETTTDPADVDVGHFLRIIRKWLWLVVLCVGMAAAASYEVTKQLTPTYRTSLTLMVGAEDSNPNVSSDELAYTQRLAFSYAALAGRQPVLEATVAALGLPGTWRDLQARVLANRVEGTHFVEIRVTDSDPLRAQATATELANQLMLQSPTTESMQLVEQRRQFTQHQLDTLQTDIQRAEMTLAEKQAQLAHEVSARGVLERQDEIKALELQLTGWRSTYASLLTALDAKRQANTLSVVEPAYVPTDPVSPNIRMNVLLAAAAGLLLALGTIFAIESASGDRVGSPDDLARALDLPALGSIEHMARLWRPKNRLITIRQPNGPVAEAFRVVRTHIQLAWGDELPMMLVLTSASLGEGKSIVSANLAVSFALTGRRTILVDADLRHPSLHSMFGISGHAGLTSMFLDNYDPELTSDLALFRQRIESLLVRTSVDNLDVLPAGPTLTSNPAELLGSPIMDKVLVGLRGLADVVILDSPPLLPVADSLILATTGLGVVLVGAAGKTRIFEARLVKAILHRAEARALGVILNRAPKSSLRYYHYPHLLERQKRQASPLRLLRRG